MLLSLSLDIASSGQSTEPIANFRERVLRVERAGPDFVLLAGEGRGAALIPPRLEALVNSAWITGILKSSCVVVGLPALHAVPFHVARALSAVDFLSAGRAGWMPMIEQVSRFDAAYGTGLAGIDAAEAHERHDDFIRATRALLDSWDDDALILDKTSGQYLDSSKVRRVDYRGSYFSTMGPLNAARPPQGYPLLVRDADAVRSSSVPADVVIGSRAALESVDAPVKLLKVDAGSQEAIDAALVAVAESGISGIHCIGAEAIEAVEALRQDKPVMVAGKTARSALGLAHPANAYSEGALP